MTKSFFFHYNKPASKKAHSPKLSIHHDYACYIVDHVDCQVPIHSHHKVRQPHCVMRGRCDAVHLVVSNGTTTAVIV